MLIVIARASQRSLQTRHGLTWQRLPGPRTYGRGNRLDCCRSRYRRVTSARTVVERQRRSLSGMSQYVGRSVLPSGRLSRGAAALRRWSPPVAGAVLIVDRQVSARKHTGPKPMGNPPSTPCAAADGRPGPLVIFCWLLFRGFAPYLVRQYNRSTTCSRPTQSSRFQLTWATYCTLDSCKNISSARTFSPNSLRKRATPTAPDPPQIAQCKRDSGNRLAPDGGKSNVRRRHSPASNVS